MKPDILTITAIVFVIGVLVSSFGITDGMADSSEIPPALHQGVAVR